MHSEPRWRPARQFTSAQLPQKSRNWLLDDGSLTGRLIEMDRGVFSVQLRYQDWQVPLPSERILLQMPNRQRALVREVELKLNGQPVVFARSVFPYTSLTGQLAHLRRLGNRALGAILFQNSGMHRSPFELAHLTGSNQYIPADLHQQQPAWARRSCFEIEGNALMVSEVFLQNFAPWPAILPVHRTQRGKVSAAIVRGKQ